MRLDHLLSKEHSSAVCIQRSNTAKPLREHLFPGGAHGWNIDIDAEANSLNLVRSGVVYSTGVGKVWVGVDYICTLLGPEGPEHSWLRPADELFLWTFSCLHQSVAGEGTARTLRTTQWTRAS